MPNNYISHLKIWYYRKFKDRIERNSFASTFKSKLLLLLFYPSTWYICDFFLFHIEIEGKGGWIIGGGGGAKGYVAPPLKLLGGGPGPPGPPSSYAYGLCEQTFLFRPTYKGSIWNWITIGASAWEETVDGWIYDVPCYSIVTGLCHFIFSRRKDATRKAKRKRCYAERRKNTTRKV